MPKPHFTYYRTRVDCVKKYRKQSSYIETEAEMLAHCARLTQGLPQWEKELIYNQMVIEHNWVVTGRPYYKVWPGITMALSNTQLSFGHEHLAFPYPVLACMFDVSGFTKTMLLSEARNDGPVKFPMTVGDDKELADVIANWSMIYTDSDGVPCTSVIAIRTTGNTVEHDLKKTMQSQSNGDIHTTDEQIERYWRVAIGVLMFATNQHELVMPEIQKQVIHKQRRGPKGRRELERQRKAKETDNCKQWLVGSEIDLPQPNVVIDNPDHCSLPGTPLTHGHIRSGHMRMQPCGPKSKDRKLVFIAPTVVRPDLPTRQMHGYRIKDPL